MSENGRETPVYMKLLQQEKRSCENLRDLLEQEWECLKNRDVTGLASLTRAKEDYLQKILEARWAVARHRKQQGVQNAGTAFSRPDHQEKQIADLQDSIRWTMSAIQGRNDRNRRYLQESLKIIEEFFSLLALPGETPPAYRRFGNQRGPAASQYFISKRL